jgi:hypothetical protein
MLLITEAIQGIYNQTSRGYSFPSIIIGSIWGPGVRPESALSSRWQQVCRGVGSRRYLGSRYSPRLLRSGN